MGESKVRKYWFFKDRAHPKAGKPLINWGYMLRRLRCKLHKQSVFRGNFEYDAPSIRKRRECDGAGASVEERFAEPPLATN
eukprot:435204-Pyramimonas_sp.AAC.1